jgi:hypothetical protein
MPGLFSNLALGRIPMLVQRLEITENTGDFFPSNTQFLNFHGLHPGGASRLGWARRGPE